MVKYIFLELSLVNDVIMNDYKRDITVLESTCQRMYEKKQRNQDWDSFINEMMDKLETSGYWDEVKGTVK